MPMERYLDLIQTHCRVEYLPWPIPEYKFHPRRKWKFDFAWPDCMIAMEIQGGIHTGGRHSRGKGQEADMEKISIASTMGWTTLLVQPSDITSKAWVRLFTDAFDTWVTQQMTWLPEDRVGIPYHVRKSKEK